MKGVLIFKLPEELEEFKEAQNAGTILARIEQLDNELRSVTKFDDPWLKEAIQKEMDEGTQSPDVAAAFVFRRLLGNLTSDLE